MVIDYSHSLPIEDAKERLSALGEYLTNRHGIRVDWNGANDRARFTGKYLMVRIDGELWFGDGVVHFRGEDPGMLWRKKAVKYLEGKLAMYLDPQAPLGSLPRGA